MTIFGERLHCPHCGKKVGRPRSPDDFICPHCKQPGPWASEQEASAWQAAEEEKRAVAAARQEALSRYRALLQKLIDGEAAATITPQLTAAATAAGLPASDEQRMRFDAFKGWVSNEVADHMFTPQEHERLLALMRVLGVTGAALAAADPELNHRVLIAEVNSGYLPVVRSPQLMARSREIVHAEYPANLMKEVAVRQYQGGRSGFSVPIGKTGVRYYVSGSRGTASR